MIRCLLATCLLAWSALAPGVVLKDLHFVSDPSGLRAELVLDAETGFRVFALTDPQRLVIDLEDTRARRSPRMVVKNGPVIGVRSAVHGKGLRVVLDLSKAVSPSVRLLPPTTPGGHHHLVIALSGQALSARPVGGLDLDLPSTAERQRTLPAQQPPAAAPAPRRDVEPAVKVVAAQPPPSARSKPAAPEPPPRDLVVAVDAGHGGKDPGATGRRGTREKDVVLNIARRLKKVIDHTPGMHAILIRTGDRFVDLRGRMERARRMRADVFVSIHADAFKNSSASGASVFVLSKKGATSEAALWLAKQENAPFLAGGVVLVDKDDDLRRVFLEMSKDASLEAGFGVAETVLARMGRVTKLHAGHVERAGFLVLKSPDIPSILVETGFLTNPAEERKLRDPAHQTRLAHAIRDGILDYFGKNPPTGTLLAVRKHTIRSGDTLSEIAEQYSVSLARLREVNGIKGDLLRVGQTLRIPAARSDG